MKACVLTRGDLAVSETDGIRGHNPYSDVWLNRQKSAEVIVGLSDRDRLKG